MDTFVYWSVAASLCMPGDVKNSSEHYAVFFVMTDAALINEILTPAILDDKRLPKIDTSGSYNDRCERAY